MRSRCGCYDVAVLPYRATVCRSEREAPDPVVRPGGNYVNRGPCSPMKAGLTMQPLYSMSSCRCIFYSYSPLAQLCKIRKASLRRRLAPLTHPMLTSESPPWSQAPNSHSHLPRLLKGRMQRRAGRKRYMTISFLLSLSCCVCVYCSVWLQPASLSACRWCLAQLASPASTLLPRIRSPGSPQCRSFRFLSAALHAIA